MLVISSIVLTANKWFSEELWPEGYSFFSNVKNQLSSGKNKDTDTFSPNEEVLKPAKIIINNLSSHTLYTKSSIKYESICKEITNILDKAIVSDIKEVVDSNEWNSHLKGKSCYFSYPVMYDATYFASQLSKKYSGNIKYFREFIVSNDNRIPSVMYVYIKDAESKKLEKVKIDFESDEINSLIDSANLETTDINYFSFELNFDNGSADGVKNHVIIDHDVLININEKKANMLSEKNRFYNIETNHNLYSDILSLFEYNTSTIRKYVESDNSMVFVENYGTLKLHSNGLLDYKSIDKNSGIELDTSSVNACLNSCITFVNNITSLMNNDKSMYYEISSDIHDIQSKSFTLTFDYYINDKKIIIPHERYNKNNAITVVVENGKITSYNQVFVSYIPTADEISCGSAIDAIDKLDIPDNSNTQNITDIFVAYKYNMQKNLWMPLWYIEDSSGNISTISSLAGGMLWAGKILKPFL